MIGIADVNVPGGNSWPLILRMATETEVRIVIHKQLLVDGPMRAMTRRATFAQGLVFKDKGPSLGLVTSRATLILPCHGQAACRLKDVAPMWIMAVHTIHETFNDRMMLRQIEFGLHVQMALETGLGLFPRIDDESNSAAGADMFAAGPVARLATTLPRHGRVLNVQPRVRAEGKFAHDVGMAIRACLVTDVMRAGNHKRRHDHGRMRGA